MKNLQLFLVIMILFCTPSWAQHWPSQPAGASTPPPAPQNPVHLKNPGLQAPISRSQSSEPVGFSSGGPSGYQRTADDPGVPQYPYPPYHNPYYDERYPSNRLTGTMERIRDWSAQVTELVVGLMDRNFYFKKSAASRRGDSPAEVSGSPAPEDQSPSALVPHLRSPVAVPKEGKTP